MSHVCKDLSKFAVTTSFKLVTMLTAILESRMIVLWFSQKVIEIFTSTMANKNSISIMKN